MAGTEDPASTTSRSNARSLSSSVMRFGFSSRNGSCPSGVSHSAMVLHSAAFGQATAMRGRKDIAGPRAVRMPRCESPQDTDRLSAARPRHPTPATNMHVYDRNRNRRSSLRNGTRISPISGDTYSAQDADLTDLRDTYSARDADHTDTYSARDADLGDHPDTYSARDADLAESHGYILGTRRGFRGYTVSRAAARDRCHS
jgi:hypothetical protein